MILRWNTDTAPGADFYGFYLQKSVHKLYLFSSMLLKKYIISIILPAGQVSSFMVSPAEQIIKLVLGSFI